jgi:hypothetical protein
VELVDGGRQARRHGGDARPLERAGGHHDVLRLDPPAGGVEHEPRAVPRQPPDARRRAHRQLEPLGVPLQVVGHLVLVGEVAGGRRERHAGEPAERGRREEAERVPAPAPHVAHAPLGVEDHEVDAARGELLPAARPA